MGTIYNAVQLRMLNNNWIQKKENGNALSRKEINEREKWTQDDWMVYNYKEQLSEEWEASLMKNIDNKIMAGGTLTPDEEKYLEQKSPQTLENYRRIKSEKKQYEQKLKKCRTKEEVARLKTETMGEYLSAFKKIENNPYISKAEKLAKAQEMLAKSRNINEVEKKFMSSEKYRELPEDTKDEDEVQESLPDTDNNDTPDLNDNHSDEDYDKTDRENTTGSKIDILL